jgi:antitoxin component of MazEF toxin-antitoxin module
MATQILRIDGAIRVEIPEELLTMANLAVGDPVEWRITETGDLALLTSVEPDNHPGSTEGYEEWKMQEIAAGFADLDAGNGVDGERVKEWLLSWGTEHELPMPR